MRPTDQDASSHARFRRRREHARSAFQRAARTIDPHEPIVIRRLREGVTPRAGIAHPFARESPDCHVSWRRRILRGLDRRRASDLAVFDTTAARDACGRWMPSTRSILGTHDPSRLPRPSSKLVVSRCPALHGASHASAIRVLGPGASSSPNASRRRVASDAPVASPFSPDVRAARCRGPARPRSLAPSAS